MLPSRGLPNLGIEPLSLMSPALVGRFFTTSATWEALGVGEIEPKLQQMQGWTSDAS